MLQSRSDDLLFTWDNCTGNYKQTPWYALKDILSPYEIGLAYFLECVAVLVTVDVFMGVIREGIEEEVWHSPTRLGGRSERAIGRINHYFSEEAGECVLIPEVVRITVLHHCYVWHVVAFNVSLIIARVREEEVSVEDVVWRTRVTRGDRVRGSWRH